MEESDVCRPRTGLFSAGVALTALHGLAGWVFGATLTGIGQGQLGDTRAWLEGQGLSLVDFLLSWATLIGALYLVFNTLVLVACAGAWFGSRGWTWTLMLLAILGAVSSGPISLGIAVLTVLGAAQVLDQSRPFPDL